MRSQICRILPENRLFHNNRPTGKEEAEGEEEKEEGEGKWNGKEKNLCVERKTQSMRRRFIPAKTVYDCFKGAVLYII